MFYVYILRSLKNNKKYYGFTSDLTKRLEEHNSGLSSYTRKYVPWEIIYYECFESRSDAMRREKYFKSYAGRKWLYQSGIGQAETNPKSD